MKLCFLCQLFVLFSLVGMDKYVRLSGMTTIAVPLKHNEAASQQEGLIKIRRERRPSIEKRREREEKRKREKKERVAGREGGKKEEKLQSVTRTWFGPFTTCCSFIPTRDTRGLSPQLQSKQVQLESRQDMGSFSAPPHAPTPPQLPPTSTTRWGVSHIACVLGRAPLMHLD